MQRCIEKRVEHAELLCVHLSVLAAVDTTVYASALLQHLLDSPSKHLLDCSLPRQHLLDSSKHLLDSPPPLSTCWTVPSPDNTC